MTSREIASKKIVEMPNERVSKILIFMAGMEAEKSIEKPAKEKEHRDKQQESTKV